jgi:hypothetical protein
VFIAIFQFYSSKQLAQNIASLTNMGEIADQRSILGVNNLTTYIQGDKKPNI